MQHFARRNGEGLIALHLHYAVKSAGASVVPLQDTVDEISLNLEIPKDDVTTRLEKYAKSGVIKLSASKLEVVDEAKLERLATGAS